MTDRSKLQQTIECFWDTVPPVWGSVRGNARSIAPRDYQISLDQFHILRHIRKGICSASDLAEVLQVSRPAISQAVDALVEKDLVARQEDSRDRRYIRLELTESGNQLLNSVFRENRRWMADKMAALKPGELDTIIQALSILKNTFDNPEE